MHTPDLATIGALVDTFIEKNRDELANIDAVVGMSRGGLIPAALIATKIDRVLVAAYIDRQDNVYFDKPDWIAGKRVLFVDDICRSGQTISLITALLGTHKPDSIKTCTLYCLPHSTFKPDYTNHVAEDVSFPWDR